METYDKLMEPDKAFLEAKREIFEIIKDDYMPSCHDMIERRLSSAIYIFDSTPDVAYAYSMSNNVEEPYKSRIREEYFDYKDKRSRLEERFNNMYFMRLCALYRVSPIKYYSLRDEIIGLDIASYSSRACSNKSSLERDYYNKRQRAYLEQCERLGLKPITNSSIVDCLLNVMVKGKKRIDTNMVRNTLFGRRIVKKICSQTSTYISDEDIATVLFNNDAGTTMSFDNGGVVPTILCSVPVIKNAMLGNPDLSLLHEVRHVAEFGNGYCGLDRNDRREFKVLNELRVENLARDDMFYFRGYPIFMEKEVDRNDPYSVLLPHVKDFLDKHRCLFNDCGVYGNVSRLDKHFGENLSTLGRSLNMMFRGLRLDIRNSDRLKEIIIETEIKRVEDGYQKRLGINNSTNLNR